MNLLHHTPKNVYLRASVLALSLTLFESLLLPTPLPAHFVPLALGYSPRLVSSQSRLALGHKVGYLKRFIRCWLLLESVLKAYFDYIP